MEERPIQVLLLEDNPGEALLLEELLRDVPAARIALSHATRLAEGMELLEERSFDAVLLDLSLPDSHGLDTLVALHRRFPVVPIVVLTGTDDEAIAVQAVHEGAQDYLVKGRVDGPLLSRSVRYAIERQRTSRYQAMLMERERFDAAVAQMSDAILVTDGDLRLTSANRAACLLLGLPEEAFQGMTIERALAPFSLSVPLPELRALLQGARTPAQQVARLEIARLHTRPPLYLDARVTRLPGPPGQLDSVVLVLRDVTEERHENNVRANFFSLISHKLRTPLFILSGYLRIFPRLPLARQGVVLEVCREELRQLQEAVLRLLDYKALSTQQLRAEAQPTDIRAAAAAAAEAVRARWPARQLEIAIEAVPPADQVEASPEHTRMILDKLLDNAVKFTERDPVRVRIRAERVDPAWLRIHVSDNGPGIPPEYHDRIFKGFVQIEDRVTGQVPGLGLGLLITQQIVSAYGGTLSLKSRLGEGSTFSFTLPAVVKGEAG